jgi:hypothetical protein
MIRIAISADAAIASILPPGANVGHWKGRPTASTVSGCLGPSSIGWRGCAAFAKATATSFCGWRRTSLGRPLSTERWAFLHDVAGAFEVAYEPLRDDVRHERIRVMPSLPALKFQRESERCRQVFGIGGRELFFEVGHPQKVAQAGERSKNQG